MTRCSFSLQGGFAQRRGRHKKIRQTPSLLHYARQHCCLTSAAAVRAQLTSSLPPLTLHTQTACNPIHFPCTLHFLLSSIYVYVIPVMKLLADAAQQTGMLRGVCCPSSHEKSISRLREFLMKILTELLNTMLIFSFLLFT